MVLKKQSIFDQCLQMVTNQMRANGPRQLKIHWFFPGASTSLQEQVWEVKLSRDAYDLCLERCTDLAGIQLFLCQKKQHDLSCTCYKNLEITAAAGGYGQKQMLALKTGACYYYFTSIILAARPNLRCWHLFTQL